MQINALRKNRKLIEIIDLKKIGTFNFMIMAALDFFQTLILFRVKYKSLVNIDVIQGICFFSCIM